MRLAVVCLISLSVLALGRGARADSPVAVLILPTKLEGNVPDRAAWQKAFDERIEAAVRRSGRSPRPSGPLTSVEASCRDATCLGRIAEAGGTDTVLLARVVADRGTPPSYRLSLVRYDRDRPGSVRNEEAECSVCTELETAERLEIMVKQALPSLVVQPRRVEPPPVTVVAPVAPAPPPRGLSRTALYGIIGGTAGIGALGIVLLGVGGRGLAIDGDPATQPQAGASQAPTVYDTRGAGIGLAASGSIMLVGAAVGIGFQITALKKTERR